MSIAARALLAVVLMIGFYLLAVGIAGVLLYLPYAEVVYANKVHARLVLFCLVGAGVILWSIVPRPDRFAPPGPRLEPAEQPKLFERLDAVAQATRQQMPVEVYLVPDVNAWVSQRGGVMGFGSRRVMGLGLPLLQTLTVQEMEAVLAHEFGHFHGGDTKLGPWVYKTRAAIGRTLQNLSQHSTILSKPFQWYGNLFLRITMAVSRNQELAADRLAAGQFGPSPLATGLLTIAGAAMAYDAYWRNEAIPVLSSGLVPPLAAGFGRFLAASSIAGAVSEGIRQEMAGGKHNPYETHPPLPERLAALGVDPAGLPRSGPPAITLLEHLPRLERELLTWFAEKQVIGSLQSVEWDAVGEKLYLPAWRRLRIKHADLLSGATIASVPELLPRLASQPEALSREGDPAIPGTDATRRASQVLGGVMVAALVDHGWTLTAGPGEPISVQRGDREMEPFAETAQLAEGSLDREGWRHRCDQYGIGNIPLDGSDDALSERDSSDRGA
ncbi:MAG: M48 family metallopeptidase [Acidobacteriota bacterium]|jgi:Zn-dependent protease with chaperone function